MPLLAALRDAGMELSSVWDLVNTTTAPPPNTVSILLDHLSGEYPDRVREGIARALAIPQARIGWTQLVDHFQKDRDRSGLGSKFAIASALATIADESTIDDLIGLAMDRRHGQNRIPFIKTLARASAPRARDALQQLALDSDTSAEVKRTLKNMGRRQRHRRQHG